MAIVTVLEMREHLGFTPGVAEEDGVLLDRMVLAAQQHIERQLGYRIADRFDVMGGDDAIKPPFPFDLYEAVKQLTAHWYANREAVAEGAREVPFGVREIIDSHRDWTF